MKVYVYEDVFGELRYYRTPIRLDDYKGMKFLGTQRQLDIHPDKKTVVKEKKIDGNIKLISAFTDGAVGTYVELPEGAKNIKVTYEVEE